MAWIIKRTCLCICLMLSNLSPASSWDMSGIVALDNRYFFNSPAFVEQRDDTYFPSLSIQPEVRHEWNSEQDRFTFVPFQRLDYIDHKRQHLDFRELNWQHKADAWDFKLGLGKVFWGVTESRHLVDVINQTDFLEDIDEEDKLGQPMLNFNTNVEIGSIDLYVLPFFRARQFGDSVGRFRPLIPIDDSNPHYESAMKNWHPDVAIRWSKTFGEWDVGIAHFRGTSREPRFDLKPYSNSTFILSPHYDIVDQTSIDVQFTHNAWLLKLEAITRSGHDKRFQAAVTGFEYTLYDVGSSGVNVGLVTEYLYDGRSSDPIKAPPTPYNNDIFFGARLSLEDTQNTELLAGLMQDVDTHAQLINIEGSRRFGDTWKIEIDVRFFLDAPINDVVLYGFHRDNYMQVRVANYF